MFWHLNAKGSLPYMTMWTTGLVKLPPTLWFQHSSFEKIRLTNSWRQPSW